MKYGDPWYLLFVLGLGFGVVFFSLQLLCMYASKLCVAHTSSKNDHILLLWTIQVIVPCIWKCTTNQTNFPFPGSTGGREFVLQGPKDLLLFLERPSPQVNLSA